MLIDIISQLCRRRPPDITSLNRILNELDSIKEGWVERNLRIGNHIRNQLLKVAFENRGDVSSLIVSKELEADISKWTRSLSDFSDLNEQNDILFIKTTAQTMVQDFDLSTLANSRVVRILYHLNNWIAVLEAKFDMMPKEGMIRDLSPFLASYTSKMANVETFGEAVSAKSKEYSAFICRFMPVYQIVRRGETISRQISIRALNGKVYSYYLTKKFEQKKPIVTQLFSLINHLLSKERETCRRLTQFAIPRLVCIGAATFVECPAAIDALPSFADVLNEVIARGSQFRTSIGAVMRYYDRIVESRGRITNKLLKDIMQEVNAPDALPVDALTRWANLRYEDATHLFTLRKQIALHLSLLCICEYIFCLNTMDLEMMNLNLSTGQISCTDFYFNICEKTLELGAERAVPFRLSANINHFLGLSVEGHFTCSLTAIARCLQQRNVIMYTRPLLWDAYAEHLRNSGINTNELLTKADLATRTIQARLDGISNAENCSERLSQLVEMARSVDNLSRMDPRWHPWF